MFTVEYVKDLSWDNEEKTSFSCTVKFKEFNEELPCGINPLDSYSHIKDIWTRALNNEFGEIKEWVYVPAGLPDLMPATIISDETLITEVSQNTSTPTTNL